MSRHRLTKAELLPGMAIVLILLLYLVASAAKLRLGFPLDDAWIHQTYARNLARLGEWSFIPGQPSGGSTAPLWTLALSLGHLLRLPPLAWTLALGGVTWIGLAAGGAGLFARRNPPLSRSAWLVALVIGCEWHLAWSAASGMETLLLALIVVLTMLALERRSAAWQVGGLIGLGVWVRPDALTLLLPAVLQLTLDRQVPAGKRRSSLLGLSLGVSAAVLPYFAFNLLAAGAPFPSTLYAKTLEYGSLSAQPLGQRFLGQFQAPLAGVVAVLLPGILLSIVADVRQRAWGRLGPAIWVAAYLGLFALRLPVAYQHGRYAMPVIPVLIALGMEGMLGWVQLRSADRARRVSSRAWVVTVAAVTLIFVGLGAQAYAQDVAIIETEMVDTARWIRDTTPADSLVAAHDIGALGYFGERATLDLAGLTSPEAIPILRDESALRAWIEREGADYLMTFPGWYPRLSGLGTPVHVSQGEFSPASGGENMVVYALPRVQDFSP